MKKEFKFSEKQFDLVILGTMLNIFALTLVAVTVGIKIVLKQKFYLASLFWFVPVNNFYTTLLIYMVLYLLGLIILANVLNNSGDKK